ncbi:MAG: L,D-transpeptidase [Methylococcales bacterium]|nr:L,D-transpeptidase [Methylococcales bacterium]
MLKIYFLPNFFILSFLCGFFLLISACDTKAPTKKLVVKPIPIKTVVFTPKPIQKKSEQPYNSSYTWLLIDTKKHQLEVKEGERTVAIYRKVSIGRRGAGFKNRRGDKITPLGTYKIGWINRQSRFRTFYGFTYPSIENAEEALNRALISKTTYHAIVNAHLDYRTPPQNTPLGGRIGLHGVGKGSAQIHNLWDWTNGCIAITNAQIDDIGYWITIGMTVKVK